MGMRDHVAEHFQNNPLWSGGTYNGHPVALASAYASLKYALKNKIFEQVLGKGEILKRGSSENHVLIFSIINYNRTFFLNWPFAIKIVPLSTNVARNINI